MHRTFLLLALAACAPDPTHLAGEVPVEVLPVDDAPVAYADFAFSQLVPGLAAGGAWVGRTPGSRVWFLVSGKGTAPGGGPCWPGAGTPCLDLLDPVTILGSVRADRNGVAHWSGVVPSRLPSGPWSFQAVERTSAGYVQVSSVVQRHTGYVACPAVWAPVCAADHQTYGNSCEAEAAGWPVVASGACP